MNKTRNKKDGRFSFRGDWTRVCKCGAELGEHMAEAPHDLDRTGCEKFRPARVAK